MTAAFLSEFATENDKKIDGISQKARHALYHYSWPGNIRELRNCIESAVVMSKSNIITVDDLPPHIHDESDHEFLRINTGSTLADIEREVIRATLAQANGNKTKTAEVLGIGRKTLHRKLQEYGL